MGAAFELAGTGDDRDRQLIAEPDLVKSDLADIDDGRRGWSGVHEQILKTSGRP
jgi:hypothetical protein